METLSIILLIGIAIILPLVGILLEKTLKSNEYMKYYIGAKGLTPEYQEWLIWKQDIAKTEETEETEGKRWNMNWGKDLMTSKKD